MTGYRGGRGGRGGRPAFNRSAPPRGMFVNGVWCCDCSPRQPAVHFQTKKAGDNKGRWFYSCQKPQGDSGRCKFFLWDDDAKPREERALLNNSRTESPHMNANTPPRPQRVSSPPPPYTANTALEQSRKRSRANVDEYDEFAFDQGVDADFTNELDHVMTAVETPRKAARTDAFNTPATRRTLPWAKDKSEPTYGLQTPQTDSRVPTDPFPQTRFTAAGDEFLTPAKLKEPKDESHQTLTPVSSPFNTPTPCRFKDVGHVGAKEDLVRDVFSLLQSGNVNLSHQTETDLRRLLSKHARKAEGSRKGQELVRLTVKTKEAKIAELECRISMLETELEAERAPMPDS